MMIISRPKMKIAELKKFFENEKRDPKKSLAFAKAALWYLDTGEIRVWDSETDAVNVWVKHAILDFFRSAEASNLNAGCFQYFDKLPVKSRSTLKGVRVVPGAIARFGSFIEAGAILMPGLVNVGARVGTGTMVDTWATVGSCAQIGRDVHLSGGVGIGGVLEPAQAKPVIIEDGAFIGSRVIVVEGVRVGKEAVLGAGVVLTASTKIVDVRGKSAQITMGLVPPRAVVIPGSLPKKFPAGEYQVPCALVIGTRTESTDRKTSLNQALREHNVAV
jgi:2,3,4,5-tetrahydropyridine-2,6-dicarboxylate N-succinyltransferase